MPFALLQLLWLLPMKIVSISGAIFFFKFLTNYLSDSRLMEIVINYKIIMNRIDKSKTDRLYFSSVNDSCFPNGYLPFLSSSLYQMFMHWISLYRSVVCEANKWNTNGFLVATLRILTVSNDVCNSAYLNEICNAGRHVLICISWHFACLLASCHS